MKEIREYEKDLASIRNVMDRSSKFISLSGLSGILAGLYALAGVTAFYYMVIYPESPFQYRIYPFADYNTLRRLMLVAIAVLAASVATAWWLSWKKAHKSGLRLWNPASRMIVINMAVPLVSGGILIVIMLFTGHFTLAAPGCLIFYGIALIQASPNTFEEVRYLGFCQIGLGLISAVFPGYGMIFWAIGFGLLHILYGAIMYNRYDK